MIGRRHAVAAHPGERGVGPVQRVTINFLMVCVLGYFLLPLLWVMFAATKSNRDLFTTFGLWFGHGFELFDNLDDLFARDGGIFARWMLNTAIYSGTAAIGTAVTSAMAGYALAKYRFRGRGLILAVTLGAIMVPPQTLVLPIFFMLSKLEATGSPLSVIVPMIPSPIGVYLMKAYAESAVPDELIDAARVDGDGDVRIFWAIAFRLLVPGVATVFLLTFVANWNNFFLPLVMLNDNDLFTVGVGLTNWSQLAGAGLEVPYSIVSTGALVSILPVILVFAVMQRSWKSGLATGGLK